jgi:hypothetical protein
LEFAEAVMVRVELPFHLRTLARVEREVTLDVKGLVTLRTVLDAIETQYPVLAGTIRDHVTQKRRPFLRFYVCEEDWSNKPTDTLLPDAVASGKEPLAIIGAIAGG